MSDEQTIPPSLLKRSTTQFAVETIADAIERRVPFSLVRLGDGEGPILSWPDHQLVNEIPTVLSTWFGIHHLPAADMQVISDGLRAAVRSADVLGLPTPFQLTRSPRYGMVFSALERLNLVSPGKVIVDANIHWYMQWSAALDFLLRNRQSVTLVGCREIGPRVAETFRIGEVKTLLVRGEADFPGPIEQPHWPDGFRNIMARLEAEVEPGEIFLIGAGALGKIYCDRIRAKGGIAIDVGSLFDSWADIYSRDRYTPGATAFTLGHFATVGDTWEERRAALQEWKDKLHSRDPTATL